jgi:hypothetical protein
MQREHLKPNESLKDFVRRIYTVRGPDGQEDPEKIDRAIQAVRKENKHTDGTSDIKLPEIPHIPRLSVFVDNLRDANRRIQEGLERVLKDERLMALSLIDPLRVGVEEMGICCTPAIATLFRRLYSELVSFDSKSYEALRDRPWIPGERSDARWVPTRPAIDDSTSDTKGGN